MSMQINPSTPPPSHIDTLTRSQSVICVSFTPAFGLSKIKGIRYVLLVLPAKQKPKGVWTFYCDYLNFQAKKNTRMIKWLHGPGGEKIHGKFRIVDWSLNRSHHPISGAWERWLVPVTEKQVKQLWKNHQQSIKKVKKQGWKHYGLATNCGSYASYLLSLSGLSIKPINPLRFHPKHPFLHRVEQSVTKKISTHKIIAKILDPSPPRQQSKPSKTRDFIGSITQFTTHLFQKTPHPDLSVTFSDSDSSSDHSSRPDKKTLPRRGSRSGSRVINHLALFHDCKPAYLAAFNDNS